MKLLVAFTLLLSFSVAALACSEDGKSGFLPENDLYIPVGVKSLNGGLNEEQFNAVITKIEDAYAPIIANMGGRLNVRRKWTDGTVNASAERMGAWNVNMYGGLARHETITEDGFALVMCHEVGHHIGGAPKVGNFMMKWASNEGQSDYFAATKCLRRIFLNDNNWAIAKTLNAPKILQDACYKQHPGGRREVRNERSICIRIGMAGVSVTNLFASMRDSAPAKFETPDTRVVSRTDDAHPAYQCRLDTFFQGALCEVSFNEDVSQSDEVKGTCHPSLGHTVGNRPLCWFKPKK